LHPFFALSSQLFEKFLHTIHVFPLRWPPVNMNNRMSCEPPTLMLDLFLVSAHKLSSKRSASPSRQAPRSSTETASSIVLWSLCGEIYLLFFSNFLFPISFFTFMSREFFLPRSSSLAHLFCFTVLFFFSSPLPACLACRDRFFSHHFVSQF